jgi:ATP-dependent helicase/nuclease subunit B
MLQVITGRFHPHLESALADDIRRTKRADPFAPLAILVPSATLLARLRHLLAVEQGLSLLNVHFLTFHQLALRLADEARHNSGEAPFLRVVDDLFFEQLIRHLVRSRLTSLTPLQLLGHSSGTWGALWSTVRDLQDAGVDPREALRGVREGYFEKDDAAWLESLFSLHAAVKELGQSLEVGSPDDLSESVTALVPTSIFLTSLQRAFYYGFYDLTQVQLSFFEAVCKTVPTTLFFPLDKGTPSGFARRFFDRAIQPCVTSPDAITRLPESPAADTAPATLSFRSVIGVEEELASTCRTILDLVETNGYQFEEIGVVARTLDPYRSYLQPVFDRHRIPLSTNAGRPLIHEPLCKVLLQLATLPLDDFYRTTVLDVVTSPLYATVLSNEKSEHYRSEQWKIIVPALQITRGIEEWKRLEHASRSMLKFDGEENLDAGGSCEIAPEVIRLLWQVVSQLLENCSALPQRGKVGILVAAFQRLLDQHVRCPDPAEISAQDPFATRLASTWDAIDRTLSGLRDLDLIGEEVTWADFVELLTHAFERTLIPLESSSHQGVQVLDVMAARGVPFKALFVLGLNEKVFPRYIREDAFLRDRHRRVLDATLGFKIDEKLNGYEEEALLFRLLCQAASHRVFLSFQRADDAGRMLASSPYLDEAGRRFGMDMRSVEKLPRRLTERVAQRPTTRMFLPPADLTQWMAMVGQDPTALLPVAGADAEAFRLGIEALAYIEDDNPSLNPFDGICGPLDRHWSGLLRRGMAPTPLERYARCPFQYFAADVLRLEPIRREIAQRPDAALLGTLCHAALRRCYEELIGAGWPMDPIQEDRIVRIIHSAVDQAAVECEVQHCTGHYLLWELAKEQVIVLVRAAVTEDQEAQAESPFTPIAFEVEAEGTVPGLTIAHHAPLKIHGRIDRLDRHRTSGALRIIDYKFKVGSDIKPEDRRLIQSAVRGYRLQPPLYACLSIPDHPAPSLVQFVFLAPNWPAPVAHSTFEAATWSTDVGTLLRKTIGLLAEGIRTGQFFILPDAYCDLCEFRVACRREHTPTWWRSYRAAEPKVLKALRAVRISEE